MLTSNNNKSLVTSSFIQEINQTEQRIAKARMLYLLVFIAGSISSLAQPNTWTQKSDLGYNKVNVTEPTARSGAVGFSIGSKGYLGTGWSFGDKADFWEYDPATNTWTQKADFGGGVREGAVGFSIGNKGYIGTGYSDLGFYYTKDFWEYDPATNEWTRKAKFGGTVRSEAVGFSIGSKGYIGTGSSYGSGPTKDFWEYDPATNTWTQRADFGGTAGVYAVGFSIGSKGYIGTGASTDGYAKDFWEYDPAANTWAQKADFGGGARFSAVGFSIGSKGYIGTGYSDDGLSSTKDFWEYDPATNAWTQKVDFGGIARSTAVGFSIGGKAYIGTGEYDFYKPTKDFWEYDPLSDTWKQKTNFEVSERSNPVGFSIGGKGYLGTGISFPSYARKDFWEYDPVANAWTQKADFGGTARHGAVGFSIGSKGYIGTGYSDVDYSFTKDFWEYDPATNTWTKKADFGGVARQVAVGFSIGSKGYIGTGGTFDGTNTYSTKDFWEYDPATNTWTQKADFGGSPREAAVGFSIGSKGYLGTGTFYDGTTSYYNKDFWEYDPATNTWTQKTDFGGTVRSSAVGFSIGSKGYIGSGEHNFDPYLIKDFWEYDPSTNNWTQKADFGGTARRYAVGFNIGGKGYIGTGQDLDEKKDFWEYSPDIVLPLKLISFAAALQKTNGVLDWQTTNEINTDYFNIQRSFNGSNFTTIAKQKAAGNGSRQQYIYSDGNVTALQQSTIFYRLQMVDKDGNFTFSNIVQLKINNSTGIFVTIYPNPGKGNFTLQMQLPVKAASTTLTLYNNLGVKLWQQDAGKLSGSVKRNIALENKLSTGVYVLQVQHGDERLMQKVVVVK